MTIQNYLVVENNIVTNSIAWDGNTQDWTPPADATMLVQADTQALIWTEVVVDNKITDYVLIEILGVGQIGFTWNTTTQVLTTNQPKPAIPVQPATTGTVSA
jgi:hypothetical protein